MNRTSLSLAVASLLALAAGSAAAAPQVTIGSAQGAAGAEVSVALTLERNGAPINVIAPLQFDFDDARLAFVGCTSAVAGKAATVQRSGRRIGMVLAGGDAVFADGPVARCTFNVLAGASGSAPLTFVRAGMADTQFNDIEAQGRDGAVVIAP